MKQIDKIESNVRLIAYLVAIIWVCMGVLLISLIFDSVAGYVLSFIVYLIATVYCMNRFEK